MIICYRLNYLLDEFLNKTEKDSNSWTCWIGLMSRVFAYSPEDRGFNPRSNHTKHSKNGT